MGRPVRILAVVAASALWPALIATPARAVTDQIKTTMTVSPKVAWDATHTEVVYTVTVAPVSNPVANLIFHLGGAWHGAAGGCTPVEYCTVPSTGPRWDFPLLSAKTTVTYTTIDPGAGAVITFDLEGPADASCYGSCGSATIAVPTVTSRVVASPSVVMPGDTLHVVVSGSANVVYPYAETFPEGVVLSGGLGAPSNVKSTIASPVWGWNSSSRTLDGEVPAFQTSSTIWVEFDTVVSAAIGSKVTISGQNTFATGYNLVNKPLTILIGPQPTRTPKPTARPSPKASGPTSSVNPATSSPTLSGGSSSPDPSTQTFIPSAPFDQSPVAATNAAPSTLRSSPMPLAERPASADTSQATALLASAVALVAFAFLALRLSGARRSGGRR